MRPKFKLKWIWISLLFLILGLSEHCLGPVWWGCNPPLLLCAVAVCSMFEGEKAGALFGLLAGLFADVMTGGVFGLRAVSFLILGYLIAFLEEKILSRNVFSCTLTGMLSVAVGELAGWGVVCLNSTVPFLTAAQYVFLPRLAMSLPVLFILYIVFKLLSRERDGYSVRR